MSAGPHPLPARYGPPATKPVTSAAAVLDAWYIACEAKALSGRKPLARTLLGRPLALYRDGDGAPGALLDRCPHRNVPLSRGEVADGCLTCPYHGWQFDRAGACQRVPGLVGPAQAKGRQVEAHAAVEQEGYVWIWGRPDVEPVGLPPRFPHLGEAGYHTVRDVFDAEATLHAVAENALDVPHTAFLHRGLFRTDGARRTLDVVVRRWAHQVEAEYLGEQRPEGLIGRILAPQGGALVHFDRFLLPNIAQVEYRLGARSHVMVTSSLTPISDFETRLYATVTFKLPLPAWLVKAVARPIGRRIFKQDADILAAQTALIHRFGGERFLSTELDVLGQHIRALLRSAERGEPWRAGSEDGPETRTIQMQV